MGAWYYRELTIVSSTEQHSIRINDRLRVCFVWRDGSAQGHYDLAVAQDRLRDRLEKEVSVCDVA
jgi:plasmid maintenance system killer protein